MVLEEKASFAIIKKILEDFNESSNRSSTGSFIQIRKTKYTL